MPSCPEMDVTWELLFVNDGSSDGSLAIMQALKAAHPQVGIIDLSRNFGKEIAISAGLDHAKGDAVVIIDADLQDPPELIPELVRVWRQEAYDVVNAQRTSRAGETWLKTTSAHLFYRAIGRIGPARIPPDVGDFRLLSRRAVDALVRLREQHRFMKGLFSWIGFPQKAVPYQRDPRMAGSSKWSYWRLWNLAIEGFTSFTVSPLKLASYLGLFVALLALLFAVLIVYKTVVYGEEVAGYPTIMVTILFLGGVQLIALGVIGEYLGRIFNETKGRPLYVLRAHEPAGEGRSAGLSADSDPGRGCEDLGLRPE